MKRIAPTDASRDAELNPVHLPDGREVSWAVAFPRDFAIQFAGTQPTFDDELQLAA
jgi:hypothetical protein